MITKLIVFYISSRRRIGLYPLLQLNMSIAKYVCYLHVYDVCSLSWCLSVKNIKLSWLVEHLAKDLRT